MKITNIINKLPWTGSNGSMDPKKISLIIIHHDGELRPERYNSLDRYIKEAKYHITQKPTWNHISYHFCIDNTGEVFQCLPLTEVGYHAGNLIINRKSIAIKFDGNFETQKPTPKQIAAYKELIKYLCTERPDLPLVVKSSIRGHRDIKATACPGKNLYPLIRKV